MRMSLTTTCGGSLGEASSASCAAPKVRCAMPSRASAFSNTQRIERSSSMIQTGFMCVHPFAQPGSRMVKRVRPGTLSNSIRPWCWLDEALRERQAEAGAAFAAAHHRIEDALGELGRHARAVVLDRSRRSHGGSAARAIVTWRAMRVTRRISPRPPVACAALRATLRIAWISCSLSPIEVGQAGVVVAATWRGPSGNSASSSVRTRSITSWMLSGSTRGSRLGVSRRFISDCRRSVSFTITWVNSRSSGSASSRSSSCAAPRMPPSGFLISWARLRISSRLACCCSRMLAPRARSSAAARARGTRAPGARRRRTRSG